MNRCLVCVVLVLGSSAFAVKKGESLYIRNRDVRVLEKPDVLSKTLVTLQPGTAVVWQGADETQRSMHKIDCTDDKGGAVSGYVLQANLSPRKPTAEVVTTDGQPIDAQAFKSSGAATKALGGTALDYAQSKNLTGLSEQLQVVEQISASIDDKTLGDRARKLGLAAPEAPAKEKKPGKKKGGAK